MRSGRRLAALQSMYRKLSGGRGRRLTAPSRKTAEWLWRRRHCAFPDRQFICGFGGNKKPGSITTGPDLPCRAPPCQSYPCHAGPRYALPVHATPVPAAPCLPCLANPSLSGPLLSIPRLPCLARPNPSTPFRSFPFRTTPSRSIDEDNNSTPKE